MKLMDFDTIQFWVYQSPAGKNPVIDLHITVNKFSILKKKSSYQITYLFW